MPRIPLALVVTASLAACSPLPEEPLDGSGYEGTPPLGEAIDPQEGTAVGADGWRWVPFPDAVCADGSATGIGIRFGTSDDLLVFLDGGGACWDYATCGLGTAVDDDYGLAKFETEVASYFPGSLTDPDVLPSSIRGATMVFVPYCTGDVHGGDRVATYSDPLGLDHVTWRHVGHGNVMRYLRRLGATFPAVRKLVVAGSSAGGFGSVANYEAFRWYWPDAQGYLVDDSGPTLVGGDVPASLRGAFYASWNLGASLDRFCPECRNDMSKGLAAIAQNHPGDRLALLSHADDAVMSTFLAAGAGFETALGRLDATVLAPTANARVFYDAGTDHMLLTPLQPWGGAGSYVASHSEAGVDLDVWLERMISGSAAWASAKP